MTDTRLIVALDVHSIEDVKSIVENLGETVSHYKVGMELFYSVGREVIEYLNQQGKNIFLDLKLHDIPNTVAEGLSSLLMPGLSIINVHASGGYTMMKNAAAKLRAAAKEKGIIPPKIIAVTILTSVGENDWKELGYLHSIPEQVICLAKLAKKAGLDGVVASAKEAAIIRRECGSDFIIVTPGIRPKGSDVNDQTRTDTPAAAIRNGSDYLVIGRPIRTAENPKSAAEQIINEMKGA